MENAKTIKELIKIFTPLSDDDYLPVSQPGVYNPITQKNGATRKIRVSQLRRFMLLNMPEKIEELEERLEKVKGPSAELQEQIDKLKDLMDEIIESGTKGGEPAGSGIYPAWAVLLVSKSSRKITINADAVLAEATGQDIEYALTLVSSLPPNGTAGTIQEWRGASDGTVTWTGLTYNTAYYVWARAKESETHNAGTAKLGGNITTNDAMAMEWEDFIEEFIIPSEVGKPFSQLYADGPAHGQGKTCFYGGVLAPNGKIIFVPYCSANVGIYDPAANTFTTAPAHGQGANAFLGGVLAPNGRIIFVPYNSANVGILLIPGLERNPALCMSPFINK
jgi:hypothetical protein